MHTSSRSILAYTLSIGAALVVGALGGLATAPAIAGWYAGLVRPAWTPPNWLFGPVWSVLYILMGIAAARLYLARASGARTTALWLYALQLALNAAWTPVFFALHAPLAGLVIIMLLAAVLAALIWQARQVERAAAWLLAPYLAWVLYATTLNAGIYFLN